MKKVVVYGIVVALVVCLIAAIFMLVNPSTPTIKSNVFDVEEWNTPEYIESHMFSIHQGVVLKKMESDNENLFDCLIEVKSNTTDNTYLVYYVDKVEHPVGEEVSELSGVWIAHYNYEESIDVVRRLPVYASMEAIEFLQGNAAE